MDASDIPRIGFAEALERLAAMPAFVEAAIEAASGEELAFRPGEEGEFSLVEHACHLRDLEREGYLVRVRRVLAEDTPALEGFDGAAVAPERRYLPQDAPAAPRDFPPAPSTPPRLPAPLTAPQPKAPPTFEGKRTTTEHTSARH